MDSSTARVPERRPLMGLFSELWRETSLLFRNEAELAKAELSEKVTQVGSGLTAVASGAAILLAGVVILLVAASNALAQFLPPENAAWLAPLIVGGIVAAIGGALLAKARRDLSPTHLQPRRTMASLRRDGALAKEHTT